MLTVKCSACSGKLQMKAAPPAGKVKCPKCGAVIAVGKPSTASAREGSVASPSLDPNDDQFDFGKIAFPSTAGTNAVTQFASAGKVALYEGPIPGDPLDLVPPDGAKSASGGSTQVGNSGKPAAKKGRRMLWVMIGVGLLVLVAAGVGAAYMLGRG